MAPNINRSRPISAKAKNYDSLVIDPSQIISLELISHDSEDIELRIFLKGCDEPIVNHYINMKAAIRFYEKLWVARKSDQQEAVEISEFSESDRI